MTEVISRHRILAFMLGTLALCIPSWAQKEQIPSPSTNIRIQTETEPGRAAEQLYLQLRSVGLDPQRVFRIREASLDRDQLHISLEDGMIGFTQDVYGHVTGAFFEGDGEILLVPPGESERASMMLFTNAAILEQDFSTAYFRFNDDTFAELRPSLRAPEDTAEFVSKWSAATKNLAEGDALRLFLTFSRELPVAGNGPGSPAEPQPIDRLLHAKLQSEKLGVFDVYYDTLASEQIAVAQAKTVDGTGYYNVWTSFSSQRAQEVPDEISIGSYQIQSEVTPPTTLKAKARMDIDILRGGSRALLFELSRNLKVSMAKSDGQPLELIQNQALEGTALARRGNDLLAVVFPRPLVRNEKIELELSYAGDVLSEAGGGLLYVGARGIWYPNRGAAVANFDLQFQYPPGWTLLATGKRVTESGPSSDAAQTTTSAPGQKLSRWVSETPIPLAGFNLGRYVTATASAGTVPVETYAARGMEKNFPKVQEQVVQVPTISPTHPKQPSTVIVAESAPSAARNAQLVADDAARAVAFYAERFGPYPYHNLQITQMPGLLSQGWPGLIFLSSYAFLTPEELSKMHLDPVSVILDHQITAHETAHQWWGDLVFWRGYRDQWISEALSNYCSMMMLESQNPEAFHAAMKRYRDNLVTKNKQGRQLREAGPATLGVRLSSSEFPEGYEAISYGRGTWLFHMLRHLLDDGVTAETDNGGAPSTPFIRALRNLRDRYAGQSMTTRQMLDGFAAELPASVRYEGKKSLEWFFEGWINGTAVPHFQLQGMKITPSGNSVLVTGTILQKDAPKELVTSIPVYALLDGQRRVFVGRVFADGSETSFRLRAPAGSRRILLDPDATLLRSD